MDQCNYHILQVKTNIQHFRQEERRFMKSLPWSSLALVPCTPRAEMGGELGMTSSHFTITNLYMTRIFTHYFQLQAVLSLKYNVTFISPSDCIRGDNTRSAGNVNIQTLHTRADRPVHKLNYKLLLYNKTISSLLQNTFGQQQIIPIIQ